MFKTIKILTRPSIEVPFKTSPDEPGTSDALKIHFEIVYKMTGLVLNHDVSYSADGLTETNTVTWLDESAANAFKEDPIIIAEFLNVRAAYFAKVGITEVAVTSA